MAGPRQASPEQMDAFSRALREAWTDGPKTLSDRIGESKQYTSQILRGEREPRRAIVFAIERAVGLPAGALSHLLGYLPVGAWSVAEAIHADPHLNPDGMATMMRLYQSLTEGA